MKRIVKSNSMLLLFFVSVVVLLVVSVIASRMMLSSAKMLEASVKQEMTALSQAVALMVTADELDEYLLPEDMQKPEYAQLKYKLHEFAERVDAPYAYYMRFNPADGMMYYIIDNVLEDGEEQDGLDSDPEIMESGQKAALTGKIYTAAPGSYLKGWDGLITSWSPVYYSNGRVSNILACVDKNDVYLNAARHNMQILAALLTASIIVVLASCFTSLFLYRRKAKQAQSASLAKSNFLSRMSHEMRTPMNAIIGLYDMAAESGDTTKTKQYLGNIKVAAEHLNKLIEDVLNISEIESGKIHYETAPVNLHREIAEIDRVIRAQTETKHQLFDVYIQPEVPPNVLINQAHIHQVLINLLSNASKFTPNGGTVALSVTLLDKKDSSCNLCWSVSDNGIGISDAQKQKLFTLFEQGDNSNTRKYGGTGLGLAITNELVNLMGGELKVESREGGGSKFYFNLELELANPAQALELQALGTKESVNFSGKSFLLVEDTEINQMIFENLFTGNYDADITIANNGKEGVEAYLADPEKYALIFMDIQMPVMDGYEAARLIRASNTPKAKTIPIIAVTANLFENDTDRAFKAGINAHVRKPFDIRQIEDTVVRLLAQQTEATSTAQV